MSSKANLWSSFSGSFKKHIKNYNEVNSIRGMRYFGPSQMSLFKLIIHSLSIIAVFKYQVFFRSSVLVILFQCLVVFTKFNFLLFQILIIFFNLLVFIVSFRENETELKNCELNIKDTQNLTH